jgi:hypothetical protein
MQTRKLVHTLWAQLGIALGLAAGGTAGCAPSEPAGPDSSAPPADLAGRAFQLTIDVATGKVSVRAPGGAARGGGGPSLSLLGSDAIELHAGDCAFSSIPNNARLKRCSMELAIENRLSATDLLAPTSFPRPPAGVGGILVFPYTAAGLGVPGGSAVPNALWDGAPANFFNDFTGCTTGKGTDCYRWESYPSPINAGASSGSRTVGFDVDRNANTVAAYIVVAADLRDNPIQTLTILPEPGNCSYHSRAEEVFRIDPDTLKVGTVVDTRSLCSFELQDVPAGVEILSADLRVFQIEAGGAVENLSSVLVDHMDYGTLDLDFLDYSRTALTPLIGSFPVETSPTFQTVDVISEVNADLAASRTRSQYRFRVDQVSGPSAVVRLAGPGSGVPPQITITYREH